MYFDEFKHQLPDIDPNETAEWLASFDQLVEQEGQSRACFLVYDAMAALVASREKVAIERLSDRAVALDDLDVLLLPAAKTEAEGAVMPRKT